MGVISQPAEFPLNLIRCGVFKRNMSINVYISTISLKSILVIEADQFFSPWLKASIADLLKFQALNSKARKSNWNGSWKSEQNQRLVKSAKTTFLIILRLKLLIRSKKTTHGSVVRNASNVPPHPAPNSLRCSFHWIFISTLSLIKLPTN